MVEFVGTIGITSQSVEPMCQHICYRLFSLGALANRIHYLRTVFAETDPSRPDNHNVYFEIGTATAVLICGGCTDFSGQGKAGKHELDAVFVLLSHLYGVPIKIVNVSYNVHKIAKKHISDECDAMAR